MRLYYTQTQYDDDDDDEGDVMSGFLLLIKALTSEGGINCLFYFIIFYNKAQTMLKNSLRLFPSIAMWWLLMLLVFLNFS